MAAARPDLVFSYRLKMMLTEDRPPLQGYDQDRWAGELHYRDVPLEVALDQLRALRAANLHVLGRLFVPTRACGTPQRDRILSTVTARS